MQFALPQTALAAAIKKKEDAQHTEDPKEGAIGGEEAKEKLEDPKAPSIPIKKKVLPPPPSVNRVNKPDIPNPSPVDTPTSAKEDSSASATPTVEATEVRPSLDEPASAPVAAPRRKQVPPVPGARPSTEETKEAAPEESADKPAPKPVLGKSVLPALAPKPDVEGKKSVQADPGTIEKVGSHLFMVLFFFLLIS